jgi:guanyl-specific ribonuclease Sa
MYRRRRERRNRIIQNVIWWHPIALLMIMFILGACAGKSSAGEITTLSASVSSRNVAAISETGGQASQGQNGTAEPESVSEKGNYTSKEEVALYLHLYKKLPPNYITKQQAEKEGWNSSKGNLSDILPGRSIGGSLFANNEGKLPAAKGRKYYECDIGYTGGYRNAKRIVYSNDGLIFYTEDHYNNFEKLY